MAVRARWVANGLVDLLEPINGSGRLLACTRAGLRVVGMEALGPGQVSIGRRPHAIAVALLAANLEREGKTVLSERELAVAEVEERRRIYSAELHDGRFHRPDLVLRDERLAIEVELSQKASWRLDSILRAWRAAVGAGKFDGVRYLCGERALRPVERAVERTVTGELIEVVPLSSLRADRQWRPLNGTTSRSWRSGSPNCSKTRQWSRGRWGSLWTQRRWRGSWE